MLYCEKKNACLSVLTADYNGGIHSSSGGGFFVLFHFKPKLIFSPSLSLFYSLSFIQVNAMIIASIFSYFTTLIVVVYASLTLEYGEKYDFSEVSSYHPAVVSAKYSDKLLHFSSSHFGSIANI